MVYYYYFYFQANVAMGDASFGAPTELALVRMIRLEQEDDEVTCYILFYFVL